ncbi:hypothetical protein FS749_014378 [Ceratobasidium sp. UAMH 11750]|nr:hypothetical protein FS749_014378 [Ceratobasidium sp. UAMH 11750]
MQEDLAIVRGPMPRSTSPSDATSETSGSDDENNDEDNSEMDTSSEVSFASGDLYVMELGQLGSIIDDEEQ